VTVADRGVEGIIGVAVLLMVTVLAVGGLTSVMGSMVTGGVAHAEVATVSGTLTMVTAAADDPTMRTMVVRSGTLSTDTLNLEITGGDITVAEQVAALRYRTDDHGVSSEFGTQIHTIDGEPVRVSGHRIRRADNRLLVGVPSVRLREVDTVATNGQAVRLGLLPRVDVDHRRLPPARYRLHLETAHPSVWQQILEGVGAEVHTRAAAGGTARVSATFDEPVSIEIITETIELEVA
jgi:flagellin-like protein